MSNFTDLSLGQSLDSTPPPTNDPNAEAAGLLIELIFYLFALVCSGNGYCRGVFKVMIGMLVEIGSALIAAIPFLRLNEHISSDKPITRLAAKVLMPIAWVFSNIAGIHAYNKIYHREIPDPTLYDDSDKFEANADGFLATQ